MSVNFLKFNPRETAFEKLTSSPVHASGKCPNTSFETN